MRRMVIHALTSRGMRVEPRDDYFEVRDPRDPEGQWEIGVTALSAQLARTPDESWTVVVDEFIERFVSAVGGRERDDATLEGPTAPVLERTYARLVQAQSLLSRPRYAKEIAPGLLRTLAFDSPQHISIIDDDHVRRHGFDRLHDAGLRNLATQLGTAEYVLDEGVHLLEGAEYVGSLVLVLSWVIETATGAAAPPEGALVAMPGRNQLMFHVIRDPDEVWHARDKMIWLAAKWYSEHAYQLSPWVYWWRPDHGEVLERVTESDDFADMMLDLTMDHAEGYRRPETDQAGSTAELTTEQWERLRRLARRSPAFIGMRIEMHDDYLEVVSPEYLFIDLRQAAGIVAGAPHDDWPDRVDEYLRDALALFAAVERELAGPTEPLLAHIYLNLKMSLSGQPADLEYAVRVAPCMYCVIEFDARPQRLFTVKDHHVARHDVGQLERAGLQNLLREVPDGVAEEGGVYQVDGSIFTAASVLVLPDVVERITGVDQLPNGVLVAMPTLGQLLFHVPDDADWTTTTATQLLMSAADQLYGDGDFPSALSPHVYWWRDGQLTQVTDFDSERGMRIAALEEFDGSR
jgi:hypothetical protein